MSIDGIFASDLASMPMKSLSSGMLVAGKGLQGDRYAELVGSYSFLRLSKLQPGEREPGRQLTMLSSDSVEAALAAAGLEKPPSLGNLRRNITVRGLSAEELLGAAGQVVKLGPFCRVLVHRHCVPCMYNERKNGIPGLMEALWNQSGVSCEVLVGGPIAVGDKVEILRSEVLPIDVGTQTPGYYVPPSKRTTDMVMGAMKMMREEKKKLLEIDPEGVDRVERSYNTVGLTFWPREKD